MGAVGIVCEYNPFHLGHLYHLQKSRELAGEDAAVICALSGDFVQRGEAAVYSKFARAEAACLCGADLVVELPPPWALSSAEGFAFGAVSLLGRLGADKLSFGSECGDLGRLSRVAALLDEELFLRETRALLEAEPRLSFAAARQTAAERRLGADGALLAAPNDLLGVEYLKAIRRLGLKMEAFAVPRTGSGHDQAGGEGFPSAWELRRRLAGGEDILGLLPAEAARVFAREREQGREMGEKSLMEAALLSRLRLLDRAAFQALPDAGSGLGIRLWRAVREEPTLEAVCRRTATRRYPLSRIRRICLCACLGLKDGMSREEPPYARVLAANGRGRALLRRQKEREAVPLLTRPASVRTLPGDSQAVFELTAAAHDLYVLGFPAPEERRGGEDWRRGPFLAESPLAGT